MLDSPYQWNTGVDGVVDAYAAMVYRLALTRVRTVPDAEDVFQEVFLRYFEKERTFENEEHRKAWLIRVTILCSRKFWSAPFRRRTVPLDETLPFEMPEESAVHAALLSLPAKYRTALHLFYFEGFSANEIATATGGRPAAVRMQLTRGRAMLREKLKGDYPDEYEEYAGRLGTDETPASSRR